MAVLSSTVVGAARPPGAAEVDELASSRLPGVRQDSLKPGQFVQEGGERRLSVAGCGSGAVGEGCCHRVDLRCQWCEIDAAAGLEPAGARQRGLRSALPPRAPAGRCSRPDPRSWERRYGGLANRGCRETPGSRQRRRRPRPGSGCPDRAGPRSRRARRRGGPECRSRGRGPESGGQWRRGRARSRAAGDPAWDRSARRRRSRRSAASTTAPPREPCLSSPSRSGPMVNRSLTRAARAMRAEHSEGLRCGREEVMGAD